MRKQARAYTVNKIPRNNRWSATRDRREAADPARRAARLATGAAWRAAKKAKRMTTEAEAIEGDESE